MNNKQIFKLIQSILVDKEFCDQNIFTYYQRSNQIHPQIRLFALQQNNIKRQPNGNANLSSIQHPKSYQSASLPKQNFTNRENPQRKQIKLKSFSTETPQQKPKIRTFKGISAKNKLLQLSQKKNLQIHSRDMKLHLKQDCNKRYTEQKPETFRYKELELNSYIEEYTLLKKQTITTVKLPNELQHKSRNENSQTSRLSIQLHQHSFKPIIKTKSRSQNQQIQQKNFNISGWSDHSNK